MGLGARIIGRVVELRLSSLLPSNVFIVAAQCHSVFTILEHASRFPGIVEISAYVVRHFGDSRLQIASGVPSAQVRAVES